MLYSKKIDKIVSPVISLVAFFILTLFFVLPLVVDAATITFPTILKGVGWGKTDISSQITIFRNWFAGIVLIVGVAIILYAGVLYMTAAGDEERSKRAKTTLIGGLTGVAVALLAYGVFTAIKSFLQ